MKGVIKFQAVCPDLEGFINMLMERGVQSWNLQVDKGLLRGEIAASKTYLLMETARKARAQVSIAEKKGLSFTLLRYKGRYGLIAGLILGVTMVFLLSNTILKIELTGGLPLSEERLMEMLADNGVSVGRFIPAINMKSAEQSIIRSDPRISWVALRVSGSRVVAEVEGVKPHEPLVPNHIPSNITAARDAQIVRVEAMEGRSKVKPGDTVAKDDLIISGTYTDVHGVVWVSHAEGRVIGRYEDKMLFAQSYLEEKSVYSGREVKRRAVKILGLEIPLWIGRPLGDYYGDYELEEDIKPLTICGIKLPVESVQRSYRLMETAPVDFSEEEAQAEARKKMEDYEGAFLENQEIIAKEEEVFIRENGVDIIVHYTLEGEIGKNVEFLVK